MSESLLASQDALFEIFQPLLWIFDKTVKKSV